MKSYSFLIVVFCIKTNEKIIRINYFSIQKYDNIFHIIDYR